MKHGTLPLAALAAVLGAVVLAQLHAGAVSNASPGAGPAAHDQEAAQDAQNPDAVEFTLSPEWGAVAGLAVDGRNNLVVVGRANSERFPTTPGAAGPSCRAGNGTLQVLSRDGAVLYSTCLGGERDVYFDPLTQAVAAADDGSVWAVANTSLPSDLNDMKVWRLAPGRASLDEVFVGRSLGHCSVAAAPGAAVWLACEVYTGQLATVNAWQPTYGGNGDVAIMRFEPGRREPALLSYLGGPGVDGPRALAVARDGDLVIVGWTYGPSFPFVRPFQPAAGGPSNFFVVRLDVSGRWVEFSSPFEVAEYAPVARVVVDGSGNTFVLAMATASCPLPTGSSVRRNPVQDVCLLEVDHAGSLRQFTMIEPGFQTRVSPDESLHLHYASVRADGSLLVARTFSHYDSARSRHYDGGAIVSVLDRSGRAIRGVEFVELESGGGWVPWAVASGSRDIYVAGETYDGRGGWVVKRVGIGRVERDRTPPAGGTGKR